MTRSRMRARYVRIAMLVLGIVLTLAGFAWALLPLLVDDAEVGAGFLGTPFWFPPWDDYTELSYALSTLLFFGLFLLLQWMFLRPGRGWAGRLAARERPLKPSIYAAAAMAMLLTAGAATLLLELPDWWSTLFGYEGNQWLGFFGIWVAMLVLWLIWAAIFFAYWRQGDRFTQLNRMIRGLIAGSLLEATVAVPVHIWATRQRGCYCERGTYTTLVACGTVLIWCFGPGVILLFMRERVRHARVFPICENCGYDLRGGHERCPECGVELADKAESQKGPA